MDTEESWKNIVHIALHIQMINFYFVDQEKFYLEWHDLLMLRLNPTNKVNNGRYWEFTSLVIVFNFKMPIIDFAPVGLVPQLY